MIVPETLVFSLGFDDGGIDGFNSSLGDGSNWGVCGRIGDGDGVTI